VPDDEIQPFDITVDEAVLDDLKDRLGRTRWPDQIPDTGWDYGTNLAYLQELCAYWRDEYDWRAHEARLKSWDHFRTEIDGTGVHFIHAPSPVEGARPLLISHGWPGSVVEFLHVIDPLRDPAAHGGDPADAFHVVAPSLPGYAWSGPTADRGWDPRRIAAAFIELMRRLGYDGYLAQGGDWGSMITTQIGLQDTERCAGIHLNMVIAIPGGDDELTEQEQQAMADAMAIMTDGAGYQQIQGTRPQTLSYGLTDSPAGLCGWIAEKFHAWTDNDGTIESAVSRDDLLTNVTTYWVTGTINSSTRLYYEAMKSGLFGLQGGRVEVPTAGAIFPKEILRASRRFAERQYDVRHWSEFDRGGHFAALEEPDLLVDDLRSFNRTL
jgi:pimeloyl-ACP methyl ester carboxylesterase